MIYLKELSHILYILTIEITQDAFAKQLLDVSLRLLKGFQVGEGEEGPSSGVCLVSQNLFGTS